MLQPGRERSRAPGDAHRQRQPAAGIQHPAHGVRLGRGPGRADDRGEQRPRLGGREYLQVQQQRAGQAGQRAARGDDDRATLGARQQRPDLGGVAGVVQHDQHPPPGHLGAVARRPLGVVGRDGRVGHAQRPQEPGQRLARPERAARAVQADVELAVGEPVAQPVGHVDGQRRLADPAHARDGRDDHRAGPAGVGLGGQGVAQHPDLRLAPGEVERVRGELGGRIRDLGRAARSRPRRRRRALPGRCSAPGRRPACARAAGPGRARARCPARSAGSRGRAGTPPAPRPAGRTGTGPA